MSARTAFRLTRAAVPLLNTTRIAAAPRALPAAQRALNNSAIRFKSDVVRETEVPVSVYAPDSKGAGGSTSDHFSIPVNRENAKPQPIEAQEPDDVVPLTSKVYNQMPPMMQKMCIMNKVVIVTG